MSRKIRRTRPWRRLGTAPRAAPSRASGGPSSATERQGDRGSGWRQAASIHRRRRQAGHQERATRMIATSRMTDSTRKVPAPVPLRRAVGSAAFGRRSVPHEWQKLRATGLARPQAGQAIVGSAAGAAAGPAVRDGPGCGHGRVRREGRRGDAPARRPGADRRHRRWCLLGRPASSQAGQLGFSGRPRDGARGRRRSGPRRALVGARRRLRLGVSGLLGGPLEERTAGAAEGLGGFILPAAFRADDDPGHDLPWARTNREPVEDGPLAALE